MIHLSGSWAFSTGTIQRVLRFRSFMSSGTLLRHLLHRHRVRADLDVPLVPERYPLWRNTLAFTTGFALIGFATFPLMPPRLLPVSYGFVDTLDKFGALWSFDSGAMHKISNQYAAMPSLHCAWAMWCLLVMWPQLKSVWARALLVLYPIATVYCIIVTANHYWLARSVGSSRSGSGSGEGADEVERRAMGSKHPGLVPEAVRA